MLQNPGKGLPTTTQAISMCTRDSSINWTLFPQVINSYSCAHHKLNFTY